MGVPGAGARPAAVASDTMSDPERAVPFHSRNSSSVPASDVPDEIALLLPRYGDVLLVRSDVTPVRVDPDCSPLT